MFLLFLAFDPKANYHVPAPPAALPRLGQERPSLDSLNSAMSGNLVMDSPLAPPQPMDGSSVCRSEVRVMMPCGSVLDAYAWGKIVMWVCLLGPVPKNIMVLIIYPMLVSPVKLFLDVGL